jgi:hypothetical protein
MPLMEFENLNINEAKEVLKRKNIKKKNFLILFPFKVENLILIVMLDLELLPISFLIDLKSHFKKRSS